MGYLHWDLSVHFKMLPSVWTLCLSCIPITERKNAERADHLAVLVYYTMSYLRRWRFCLLAGSTAIDVFGTERQRTVSEIRTFRDLHKFTFISTTVTTEYWLEFLLCGLFKITKITLRSLKECTSPAAVHVFLTQIIYTFRNHKVVQHFSSSSVKVGCYKIN